MNGLKWPAIIEGTGILQNVLGQYSDAIWVISPSIMDQLKDFPSSYRVLIVKRADTSTLSQLQDLIADSNASSVIAIGGGKVIDIAKLAANYERIDHCDHWGEKAVLAQKQLRQPLQLIVVPSTAGSGSEASETAVLTVNDRKIPIYSERLLPDLVLLETELVALAPPRVLWNGVWDTLVHALESSLSPLANSYTLPHSLEVFRSSKKIIDQALETGSITKEFPAATAQWNSIRAGKIQSKASVGLAHALAHQSEHTDQWHGEACARVLPRVLSKNTEKAEGKMLKFAHSVGFESIAALLRWVEGSVNHSVGAYIPKLIPYEEKEQVILRTMKDPCFRTNPVFWTRSELTLWLEEWFYG
ncbi:alcohol dehydrogenase class IV [Paenibacillus forsythiae]|uniref:Alcohol dehydrogenase class IV n=1 Tax=Paenibacillus forsythiae TaxID=365616 RepID=A0ABU3HE89_9BACL|nr:iron-containing alcohol dehydrogenase [Paenibacillus forsythiae]MDT3427995.1 alcohol dehydrogenase class IV [Paenibacillus forsythiae]